MRNDFPPTSSGGSKQNLYLDNYYSLGYPSNAKIGYFISIFPYPYSKKIVFTLTTEVNNTSEIKRLNTNYHNVACSLLYNGNQKRFRFKALSPKAFADHKESPYVVIMGGVSEAGGIGDIIKKALGEKDFTAIGKGEAKGMYLKYNVWSGGQEIIVFAAANAADVGAVRKESRSDWWETISEWFEIEDEETSGGGGTPAY